VARRPASVRHGQNLECVAVRVVPVEPATALGAALVDAVLAVPGAGVRSDAVAGQALRDLLELAQPSDLAVSPSGRSAWRLAFRS
jgi:hypothetical protein